MAFSKDHVLALPTHLFTFSHLPNQPTYLSLPQLVRQIRKRVNAQGPKIAAHLTLLPTIYLCWSILFTLSSTTPDILRIPLTPLLQPPQEADGVRAAQLGARRGLSLDQPEGDPDPGPGFESVTCYPNPTLPHCPHISISTTQ